MPRGSDVSVSSQPFKGLLIADSGSGKTGALASLAKDGYDVVIMDFDNGVQILQQVLRDDKTALSHLYWETFTNRRKLSPNGTVGFDPAGGTAAIAQANQFFNTGKALDGSFDLGPVMSWDQSRVLVLDSLTFYSLAMLAHVLKLAGRLPPARPEIQDWGNAMEAIEGLLGLLYSDDINCHVIIMSHISYVETEDSKLRGYPSTLGSKLPPKVGRYFNSVLGITVTGAGEAAKRQIITAGTTQVPLKTSAPGRVKPAYPLETGLAQLFRDLGYTPPK